MIAALASPRRGLALVRLAAIPLFFAAERLVDYAVRPSPLFDWLLAIAAVYALAAFALEWRRPGLVPAGVLVALDFAAIVALIAASGGPFSQLRYALFVLPVAAAALVGPGRTALAALAALAAYIAIAATYPDAAGVRPDAFGFESTQALFLGWMGLTAVVLSSVLAARERRIRELAASRGRLVAQALDAEDRARRRLAEALHDDALQNLLAARQLLGATPDPGALALVRDGLDDSVSQIRDAVFDLHPHLLEPAGLQAALEAVAARQAARGGCTTQVHVDPAAAGAHDQLLFAIARELITNASKHAHATRLDVHVDARGDAIELRVRDDGTGIDPAAARAAVLNGHIGLASARERAEALGGQFTVHSRPGAGTEIIVRLPSPRT